MSRWAALAAAARGRTLVPWPGSVRPAFPFVVGGIAGTVAGLKVGVGSSLARAVRGNGPGPVTTVAPVLVGAGLVVGLSAAGSAAAGRMLDRLVQTGRGLDPGFAVPPPIPASPQALGRW